MKEMNNLDAYTASDYSVSGTLAKELLTSMQQELREGIVPVTSDHNSDIDRPSGLTPRMANWFRIHIVPRRSLALSEIRAAFQEIDFGKGLAGFIPEVRNDEIENEKFRQILSERKQFFSSASVLRNEQDLEQIEKSYEEKKMKNGGEDAHEWPLLPYVFSLVFIALPEAFLNYSSLAKTFSKVPAIALGLTVIVAIAIAWASHMTGLSLKQWRERFGGAVADTERSSSIRFLVLANMLFLISLAIVGYSRYNLFIQEIETIAVTGGTLGFRQYAMAAASILGNILVYLLGIVIAFVAHSKIPNLGRDERIVKKLRTVRDRYYRQDLEKRIGRHISVAQKERENLNSLVQSRVIHMDRYKSLRTYVDRFLAADNAVIGLLERYKGDFVAQTRSQGLGTRFSIEDVHSQSADMLVTMSAEEYETQKIKLRLG